MTSASIELQGNWSFPTTIRFGAGEIQKVADDCSELGIRRPLLVTDEGSVNLPFFGLIQSILKRSNVNATVFSSVVSNPTDDNIVDGVTAYRSGDCDGVIAIGGGSGIDAGKAIALMIGQSRPLADFEDVGDNWRRVNQEGLAPCIAIPTTAGTGSEVGRASVIVDTVQNEKKIIFHPRMMPSRVICDPELTVNLPPRLTAATGIDAFTHCLEAFCVPTYHPIADGIALKGMQLVARWLPIVYADGSNIEARAHMMAAASMGAAAFQKGLGAVHALSHAVGAQYNTHHGLTNAVFLPYVLIRNRSAIEEMMKDVGAAVGTNSGEFEAVLGWILEFRDQLGIPNDAKALGVRLGS